MTILGLARRSGKIVVGCKACEESIKRQTAKLIIVAEDAGNSTKRNFWHLANKHHVKILDFKNKKSLGELVGFREAAVLVVTDTNFAQTIGELYKSGGE